MPTSLLQANQAEQIELQKEQDSIHAAAEKAGEWTDVQRERDDAIVAQLTALKADEVRMKRHREAERTEAAVLKGVETEVVEASEPRLPTPFGSFGEQLRAVVASSKRGSRVDERLVTIETGWAQFAAAQGMNEAIPSEGGFLVQHDFGTELYRDLYDTGILASRTRRRPVSGNGFKANAIDETSRADGSRMGGIQAFWLAEAATKTSSKPKLRQIDLDLEKLIGLYYATDELLEDAPSLEAEVRSWFTEEFGFKLDDGIIRGDGVGKPLGILNSGALVTQAAEGGQTADTINATNVVKMFGRLPSGSVSRAVWLINQGAFHQLPLMTIANQPVWLPGGSLAAAPYGALLGRPVLPCEQCSAIGDVGDIILADLSRYLLIEKNGIQTATSIHVEFLTDQTAFRFVLRTNGQPINSAAVTPYKGSATLSPFVTLAAR